MQCIYTGLLPLSNRQSCLTSCGVVISDMAEHMCEAPSEEPEGTNEPAEVPAEISKQMPVKHHCRRRHRRGCADSFATYFPRVLKNVHQGLSLSRGAVSVMDSFVKDIFERIADEASFLVRYTQCTTITYEEIQTAVRLLLPGKLGEHAVVEGTKAILRDIFRKSAASATNI